MAYKLYNDIMQKAVLKPLLEVLEKIEDNKLELNMEFKEIKSILQQNWPAEAKMIKIRETMKHNPKEWEELYLYLRPDYVATLVMSETTKIQKLEELVKNNHWVEFTQLLEIMNKEKNSINTLEIPKKFINEILQIASKHQHLEIYQLLFENRNYNDFLFSAIKSGEIPAVQVLLSSGLDIYREYHYIAGTTALGCAILNNQHEIASLILKHILGDFSNMQRDKKVNAEHELMNTNNIIIQVGDNVVSPILLKYYSKKTNQIITHAILYDNRDTIMMSDAIGTEENIKYLHKFSSLKDVIEYIQSIENSPLIQTIPMTTEDTFTPTFSSSKPSIPTSSAQSPSKKHNN